MGKDKHIPQLRFPGFEGEWEQSKIGNIAEVKTGNKDTQNKTDDGLYPFYVRSDNVERINSYSYDGEAILTSGDGVGVGKNFHYVNGKFDFHQRVYSIRKIDGRYDGKFFFNVFATQFYDRIKRVSAKNSVDSVRMEMITQMEISFPSLPEQQKIASFFTAIDKKIALLKQQKEKLQQYKQGVIQQIFSRQLRFKTDEGKDFPDWMEKNGNEVFETVSDKNHNSDLPILAITQEYGAVPRDMIDYQVSVSDKSVESYKVVEVGDYIISLRSFQGGIEYSNYKGICSPAYIILRPAVEINREFYKCYFKTASYITDLNKKLEGIRDGKMISYKNFSDVKLPFPSLEEQTKIANFLSAIDEKINRVQAQTDEATQWKKGLLQKMFV